MALWNSSVIQVTTSGDKSFCHQDTFFCMDRLDHIEIHELHELLGEVDGKQSTQRVLAAIGRKQGAKLDKQAERHDVAEKTVRNRLDRFGERALSDAPYGDERSGRPTKLSESERQDLYEHLHESPTEFGYDREVWFPGLVQKHIEETFSVECSLRHVYRLMGEAGRSS